MGAWPQTSLADARRWDLGRGRGGWERSGLAGPASPPDPSSLCGQPRAARAARGGCDPGELRDDGHAEGSQGTLLIADASRASFTKGVSTLRPSPVSMVTCSAPIQTAVLY